MKENGNSGLIQRLDHIAVKTSAPEKLFLFFTEILGLPVIWPVNKEPGFTTGGFFVGDANVETLPLAPGGAQAAAHEAAISAITFESRPFSDIGEELQRHMLQPSEPLHSIRDYDGRQYKAWTSLSLDALSSPRHTVYLREYDKSYRGQMAKTVSFTAPLGAVGLLGMHEIELECADLRHSAELWSRLLGAQPNAHIFKKDGMPALKLSAGKQERIASITLKVKSLQKTMDFLKEKHLLGAHEGKTVSITPRAIQGLHIKFIQHS
ncbi:MAG: hypothetical protein GX410_02185 [Elusimicrobia bacterium]|nr:hypothetical protein [Elusimicrobiota bacterium]